MILRSRLLEIEVDPKTAVLGVRRPGDAAPVISGGLAAVRAGPAAGPPFEVRFGAGGFTAEEQPLTDAHGTGRQVALSARELENGLALRWVFRLYDERPCLLLRLEAANRGRELLSFNRFTLLAGQAFPASERKPAGFFKAGWHDWVYAGFRRAGQWDVRSLLAPWSAQGAAALDLDLG